MTPRQIALVRSSFAQVEPVADQIAALFYQKLFALDPALRPLFHSDLSAQARKLMRMLAAVVNGLERPDTLLPVVQDLGRRHVAYGVRPHHYDSVGTALLWTLEKSLGPAATHEVKEAWAAAYGFLARAMKDAAYPKASSRPVPILAV